MRISRFVYIVLSLLLWGSFVRANDKADCEAGGGNFLIGTVVQGPQFKPGARHRGIYLSHTHIGLKADGQNDIYDVAIDNIFASDYVRNAREIPPSLNAIRAGDRLELCGKLYNESPGIDWVHTNCGDRPTPDTPTGWVKEIDPTTGKPGQNLEGSQRYCDLWPRN